MLVQTAIPELAIETFHKSILSRFAWLYEVQFYPVVPSPKEHRFGCKFSAVITNNTAGLSSFPNYLIEASGYPLSADRYIDNLGNAFATVVIDKIEDPKASSSC